MSHLLCFVFHLQQRILYLGFGGQQFVFGDAGDDFLVESGLFCGHFGDDLLEGCQFVDGVEGARVVVAVLLFPEIIVVIVEIEIGLLLLLSLIDA